MFNVISFINLKADQILQVGFWMLAVFTRVTGGRGKYINGNSVWWLTLAPSDIHESRDSCMAWRKTTPYEWPKPGRCYQDPNIINESCDKWRMSRCMAEHDSVVIEVQFRNRHHKIGNKLTNFRTVRTLRETLISWSSSFESWIYWFN